MYQLRWYISFNINYIVFLNTKLRITGQNQGVLYTQCFDQFSSPCHWLLPWLLWRCRGCYFYKCQEKPLKFTLAPPRWISKAPQDVNNSYLIILCRTSIVFFNKPLKRCNIKTVWIYKILEGDIFSTLA